MMHQQSMMVGDMMPVHPEMGVHGGEELNNMGAMNSMNNVGYENNAAPAPGYAYDELFPALPHSQPPVQRSIQQVSNKLRVGSSLHTQVFHVPYEERKLDNANTFGEGESLRTCQAITKDTGAHIEISTSKDGSLTFLITGKHSAVLDARRQILTHFQQQISTSKDGSLTFLITGKHSAVLDARRQILTHFQQQVTREYINKTTRNKQISTSKDGSLTFLITGKHSAVLDARRQILTHFQQQASKQISIPKEHHRWILGKQGQKLKDLEKVTATKISVPSIADTSELITITGTKEGIEKAEHEIRICSEEQSRKAMERITIPKIYHPFIQGPYGERAQALSAETGARIHIPPASTQSDEIVVAGEKNGVLAAKAQIEQIYEDMVKKCSTVRVEVPKSQHKYVIGARGTTIQEILKETGVSVEMPPPDSTTGTITLHGPHNKIGLALSKVCEKANSVKTATVDAPTWIHKYIIGKNGSNIKKITQDFSKVHVDITHSEDKVKIDGPPEEVERAQVELDSFVKNLLATLTYVELTVDPKFFKHIIGKSGSNINRLKDETGVVINIIENEGNNVIRIEGSHQGVADAERELREMVSKLENERTKEVMVDHRYIKSLIGVRGDKIKEIREKFDRVLISLPDQGQKRSPIKLRGPQEDIEKCEKYLNKLLKEIAESSYVQEVPIFKQFHKFIIGKGGANLRKIRDETQTTIDLPAEGDESDVITVRGKRENVEEAVKRIQQIHNEKANIVTEEVTIAPKYYNSLIGAGGKLIHSIMEECGGVLIKFPPAESDSDKVIIKGPIEDVEKAKQQLLAHATERELTSHTATVRAKPEHHKFLIGKSGANIKKIREQTGARIVFPTEKDEDKEAIYIIGREEQVANARKQLEAAVAEISNVAEGEMTVPPRHHRHFVARRGEVLRRIADDCGGVQISFPRQGVNSDRVVLKGPKDCIEAAKIRINEIIEDLEAKVTIECIIPQRHHRTVMGARGTKVKDITAEFDVQIKFPERDTTEGAEIPARQEEGAEPTPNDVIRITGRPENCEAAKKALLEQVPITIDVEVPNELHKLLAGQKRRELMQTYDVHVLLPPNDDPSDIVKLHTTSHTSCSLHKRRELMQTYDVHVLLPPNDDPSDIVKTYDVHVLLPPNDDPSDIVKVNHHSYTQRATRAARYTSDASSCRRTAAQRRPQRYRQATHNEPHELLATQATRAHADVLPPNDDPSDIVKVNHHSYTQRATRAARRAEATRAHADVLPPNDDPSDIVKVNHHSYTQRATRAARYTSDASSCRRTAAQRRPQRYRQATHNEPHELLATQATRAHADIRRARATAAQRRPQRYRQGKPPQLHTTSHTSCSLHKRRELMQTYDVHVLLPPNDDPSDIVKVNHHSYTQRATRAARYTSDASSCRHTTHVLLPPNDDPSDIVKVNHHSYTQRATRAARYTSDASSCRRTAAQRRPQRYRQATHNEPHELLATQATRAHADVLPPNDDPSDIVKVNHHSYTQRATRAARRAEATRAHADVLPPNDDPSDIVKVNHHSYTQRATRAARYTSDASSCRRTAAQRRPQRYRQGKPPQLHTTSHTSCSLHKRRELMQTYCRPTTTPAISSR
ncbi:KH domain-containing protein [Phthorimaea operculella]|nr:KH domain-containing protein [Phthorimaea operculella]